MSYQVLARKWRPKNFEQMVGQEHVLKVLSHALDNNRIHHAFLFTGTRGVGKTTLARILAKALNCEQGISSHPCCECDHCRDIDAGRFFDLIEVDAASRTKVDDTRDMLENVQYMPANGRYKIYLIDEVHMLSTHSFNALLKTLEEPPAHVKFLLATTDPQKLPVTILSRCLQFHLKALSIEQIMGHLQALLTQEQIEAQPAALKLIARAAEGSVRDSLSLLDQAISMGHGAVIESEVREMLGVIEQHYYFDLLDALAERDGAALLAIAARIAERSASFTDVLSGMIDTLYATALAQTVPSALTDELGDSARIQHLAARMSSGDIQLYYQIALNGRRDLALSPHPRVGFEMVLLRMLAFTPSPSGSAATSGTTPGTGESVSAPRPNVPQHMPSGAMRHTASVTAQHSSPDAAPTAAASSTQGAKSTENARGAKRTESPQTTAAQADVNELLTHWHEVIPQLGLDPMTEQFARNCSVRRVADKSLTLAVDASVALLQNATRTERLQKALAQRYAISFVIELTAQDTLTDSPASREKAHQHARQANAQQSLLDDPVVRAVQERFDAILDPNTIQPN